MKAFAASIVLVVATGALAPADPAAALVGNHAPQTASKFAGDLTTGQKMSGHPRSGERPTDRKSKPKGVVVKPGKYRGNFYTSSGKRLEKFTFRVTKDRKVKKFDARLNVTCSYYPPAVETHPFSFPTTPIKAKGSFRRVWTPNTGSRIVLKGKLKRAKLINGSLDYTVGVCVRTAQLKARRVGK